VVGDVVLARVAVDGLVDAVCRAALFLAANRARK
jgi:hypothetical protein